MWHSRFQLPCLFALAVKEVDGPPSSSPAISYVVRLVMTLAAACWLVSLWSGCLLVACSLRLHLCLRSLLKASTAVAGVGAALAHGASGVAASLAPLALPPAFAHPLQPLYLRSLDQAASYNTHTSLTDRPGGHTRT